MDLIQVQESIESEERELLLVLKMQTPGQTLDKEMRILVTHLLKRETSQIQESPVILWHNLRKFMEAQNLIHRENTNKKREIL